MITATPTAAPLTTVGLVLLEAGRNAHGDQCWWNHLEARWICSAS